MESPAYHLWNGSHFARFRLTNRYSFATDFPLPLLKAIRGVLTGHELNGFLAWRANREHVCPLGRT
jgi:hypothetical protein